MRLLPVFAIFFVLGVILWNVAVAWGRVQRESGSAYDWPLLRPETKTQQKIRTGLSYLAWGVLALGLVFLVIVFFNGIAKTL